MSPSHAGGVGGVPAGGVKAVVLNVTVVPVSGSGYATVYPQGSGVPNASNLNWHVGTGAIANTVVAKVGTDGLVRLRNVSPKAHFVVDVQGYFAQ